MNVFTVLSFCCQFSFVLASRKKEYVIKEYSGMFWKLAIPGKRKQHSINYY
jgi:hypothetical protein